MVEFVRTVMREGIDYGRIPGTDKPTLLKPGAEKHCTLFGLACRFDLVRSAEGWGGSHRDGEPFFSFEQKYSYRKAQRRCPSSGVAAIIKGKEEYGGGWLCFRKKGGCTLAAL